MITSPPGKGTSQQRFSEGCAHSNVVADSTGQYSRVAKYQSYSESRQNLLVDDLRGMGKNRGTKNEKGREKTPTMMRSIIEQ